MVAVQNLKGEGGYHSVRSLTVLVEIWSDKEWWPWTGVSLYFDLNYPHLLKRSNGIYIYIYILWRHNSHHLKITNPYGCSHQS